MLQHTRHALSFNLTQIGAIGVLYSDVLGALNVSHIDWLNLDMEDNEMPALMSFPWFSPFFCARNAEG